MRKPIVLGGHAAIAAAMIAAETSEARISSSRNMDGPELGPRAHKLDPERLRTLLVGAAAG